MNADLAADIVPRGRVFSPQDIKPNAGKTNCVEDDTAALQYAVAMAVLHDGCVELGAGRYRITAPIGSLITVPISIIGAGPSNSIIYVDPVMVGDVISFRNTWYGAEQTTLYSGAVVPNGGSDPHTVAWGALTNKKSGVCLSNFSVIGDRRSVVNQNGIMFYDRNDAVKMLNVEVECIKGVGLGLSGFPSSASANSACMIRESAITDCQARWCGDALTGRPAVAMNCNSKTIAQAGGSAANLADDANNYNFVRGMKIVFSDGVSFQGNCYNLNDSLGSAEMHDNWIELIVDTQQAPEPAASYVDGGLATSPYCSITSGVLTITSGVTFTKLDGTGAGSLAVGTYLINPSVPSGTYISSIISSSGGGVGQYQLANKNADVSTLTVIAATLGSCRFTTPCVQLGGGHAFERYDITLNNSHIYGSNSVGIEVNQNPLNVNTAKMRQTKMALSCGEIDQALFLTTVNTLHVDFYARTAAATGVTALNITQTVTVDMQGLSTGQALNNIAGNKENLHVYPGGQKVVNGSDISAIMQASKWPNCSMILNNAGVYTRYLATPAGSWVAAGSAGI